MSRRTVFMSGAGGGMGYESMIRKALAEGKLRSCIIGYGEYAIPSRDPRFDRFTDYEILLRNFDWYQKDLGREDSFSER